MEQKAWLEVIKRIAPYLQLVPNTVWQSIKRQWESGSSDCTPTGFRTFRRTFKIQLHCAAETAISSRPKVAITSCTSFPNSSSCVTSAWTYEFALQPSPSTACKNARNAIVTFRFTRTSCHKPLQDKLMCGAQSDTGHSGYQDHFSC